MHVGNGRCKSEDSVNARQSHTGHTNVIQQELTDTCHELLVKECLTEIPKVGIGIERLLPHSCPLAMLCICIQAYMYLTHSPAGR